MKSNALIKNIEFAKPLELAGLVDYHDGQVVSLTFAQSPYLSFTLFAFSAGEGLSAHTVAADAFVQILDGEAKITIGEKLLTAHKGQVVVMPQGRAPFGGGPPALQDAAPGGETAPAHTAQALTA